MFIAGLLVGGMLGFLVGIWCTVEYMRGLGEHQDFINGHWQVRR